jgi:excisionase family DNA binding protein
VKIEDTLHAVLDRQDLLLAEIAGLKMTVADLATRPERVAWSIAETAEALGLGLSTVRRLIQSGDLAHVKVYDRTLIPQAAIASFLGMARHTTT